MSHAEFGRGDTGIHTVEGTISGRRAAKLAQKREQDQQEFEAKKRKIQDDSSRAAGSIDSKFKSIATDPNAVRGGKEGGTVGSHGQLGQV
jgi:hypothetical protein